MTDYLLFRLYGPMASWGDIAVGENRPSLPHPSKSAVLGMVAAAVGIKRDEEDKQQQLSVGYGFSVLVHSIGTPLSDYHTVQVPSSGTGRNRRTFNTRRDEIVSMPKHNLNTILSRRDYRLDAFYTVVLWQRDGAPYELKELADKLNAPVYHLYIGRKSCPLALPVKAQVVNAASIKEAFTKAEFPILEELQPLFGGRNNPMLYWEYGVESGIEPQHTFSRRDLPLSRKRWQFDIRREYQSPYPEEAICISVKSK